MAPPPDTTERDNPADRNRDRHQRAIEGLAELLQKAAAPTFRGTIGVEIPAKDGRLGEPKFTCVRFGFPET